MKFTGLALTLLGSSLLVNAGNLPEGSVHQDHGKHLGNHKNGTHVDHGNHYGQNKNGTHVDHGKHYGQNKNGTHVDHGKHYGQNKNGTHVNNGKHYGQGQGYGRRHRYHKKRPNHGKKRPTPTTTTVSASATSTSISSSIKSTTSSSAPSKPTSTNNKPSTSSGGLSSSEIDHVLALHNNFRAQYSAPPLTWNEAAANFAHSWVSRCQYGHSQNRKYGENIAMGQSSFDQVVQNWANDEADKYDYGNPGFSMETGHFTQVVWKSTSSVGCAVANCSGRKYYSCNYEAPGNYEGEYQQNVLPKI